MCVCVCLFLYWGVWISVSVNKLKWECEGLHVCECWGVGGTVFLWISGSECVSISRMSFCVGGFYLLCECVQVFL